MSEQQNKQIYITMLGDFTLVRPNGGQDEVVKADLNGRSRRLWMIIAYLIINREQGVSAQELIDAFWPDSDSNDPLAKLQNNISRTRALLETAGFESGRDMVAFENGIYRWAPGYVTTVDVDELERMSTICKDGVPADELDNALAACMLHNGEFLEHAKHESWCLSLNIYYSSMFMRLAKKVVEKLFEQHRLDDIELLCLRVLETSPASEEFSAFLMRALTMGGNPQKALEHFEHIEQQLAEVYGVEVSAVLIAERENALQKIYGEAMTSEAIQDFIMDEESSTGAFLCNNAVFRDICKLAMRDMRRSGVPSQLLVISFRGSNDKPEKHAADVKRLEDVLTTALRAGDPFTKMGQDQFLALLMGASEDNTGIIVDRILDRFHKNYPRIQMQFKTASYSLDSLNVDVERFDI